MHCMRPITDVENDGRMANGEQTETIARQPYGPMPAITDGERKQVGPGDVR